MKQDAPGWLDIAAAAALVGRSITTIRRILPEIPAPDIKREPLASQGGHKVLISRRWLLERYGIPDTVPPDMQADTPGAFDVLESLEKQLQQKDRQINALQMQVGEAQRQVGELVERLAQLVAVNTALSQKLLSGTQQTEPGKEGGGPVRLWYMVAVSVVASLVLSLLVWLWLRWLGE